MDPDLEEYMTFYICYGSYKYKVLLFRLYNRPATYQRYINDILMDYIDDFVMAYLDDILIYSKDPLTYIKHVKKVLTRLYKARLYTDIKKSEFYVT